MKCRKFISELCALGSRVWVLSNYTSLWKPNWLSFLNVNTVYENLRNKKSRNWFEISFRLLALSLLKHATNFVSTLPQLISWFYWSLFKALMTYRSLTKLGCFERLKSFRIRGNAAAYFGWICVNKPLCLAKSYKFGKLLLQSVLNVFKNSPVVSKLQTIALIQLRLKISLYQWYTESLVHPNHFQTWSTPSLDWGTKPTNTSTRWPSLSTRNCNR